MKYVVESKRSEGRWCRVAVWSVPSGRFRAFLDYTNNSPAYDSDTQTRVRRIHGDPPAEFNYPKDKVDA